MNLPLKRLSIYSSGVDFFEHSGKMDSAASINLSFKKEAINDALKSLAVNDPESAFPSIQYALSSSMEEALKSFKIDLSGNPGIADILRSQRGAEIEIFAPSSIKGCILGVEKRKITEASGAGAEEDWFSLVTSEGEDLTVFAFYETHNNEIYTNVFISNGIMTTNIGKEKYE